MIGSLPAITMIRLLTAIAETAESIGMRSRRLFGFMLSKGSCDIQADLFFKLMSSHSFELYLFLTEFVSDRAFVKAGDSR